MTYLNFTMKNHRTSYKTQNCSVMTVEILKNPLLRNIAAYIYSEISSLFLRNTERICVSIALNLKLIYLITK